MYNYDNDLFIIQEKNTSNFDNVMYKIRMLPSIGTIWIRYQF